MKCPVCDLTLSISSREGVEIDFCPQCRGVWLDRGELDKILDRVATNQTPAPRDQRRDERPPEPSRQPRYDERSHRHDDRPRYDDDYRKKQNKKKKAKSFIEDIFDF